MSTLQFRWIMSALYSIAVASASPLPLSVLMAGASAMWALGAVIGGRRRHASRLGTAGKPACAAKEDRQ